MQEQLILNRYRPIAEAGSGGFSTVQLAWDTRIQRRVAIKCIALDESDLARSYSTSPDVVADEYNRSGINFENMPGLNEARTAAMLSDPHIVGVYDFEVQGAMAYLIMEYVDGMTLTELLEQYGDDLSLDAIAAVFSSVAQALIIAHDNQVLHLDIKPDNVLINRQGQVKVTDFGLATLSDALGFGQASGGTIGYMPLEQMRQESLDARCDEWALASMTYEMINGKNPFLAQDLAQAEKSIVDAELILPSLCRDDLSPAIDDVIFYALDPAREERYNSIEDFSEELTKFLGSATRGHKEIAVLVGQATEDTEKEEDVIERISFFDRIDTRAFGILVRLWSAASVGILSFVALGNMPFVETWTSPLFWGLLALFVLAGVFKPHLGAFLGLGALSVALFANQAYVVGSVLVVAVIAWWFFIGRFGDVQANAALSPALFGAFGFNAVTPLLTGFSLTVKDTFFTALFTLFLSIILAGFGSHSLMGWNVVAFWDFSYLDIQHNILVLLQQPLTWFLATGWLIAALIVSLFCKRQTRLFAGIGVVLATGVLLAALIGGTWMSSGQTTVAPAWYLIVPILGAGIVMTVASALGVPVRYEEEY